VLFKKSYVLLFIFLIVFSVGVQSSGKVQEQTLSSERVNKNTEAKYRMVEHLQTIKDKESPVGEWEISTSYPELYGAIKESVKTKINNAIVVLANKYKCSNNKESTFRAEVMYLDEHVLSLRYDVSWFCNGMSYSSTSGSVNWNLSTGVEVVFDSEFVDNSARENFYLIAVDKIEKKLKADVDCPAKDKFDYFYKAKKALIFVAEMEFHVDSGCITEIKYPLTEMKKYLNSNSILLRE